jgi:hypothetical protein
MKSLFYITAALVWLSVVGYSAHVLAETVADSLDNTANLIAASHR